MKDSSIASYNFTPHAGLHKLIPVLSSKHRTYPDIQRDQTLNPMAVLAFLNLQTNQRVLVLNSQDGYWSVLISALVGLGVGVWSHNPSEARSFFDPIVASRLSMTERSQNPSNLRFFFNPFVAPVPPTPTLCSNAECVNCQCAWPGWGGQFDVVLSFDGRSVGAMSGSLADDADLNSCVYGLLKPGGRFVVADLSGESVYARDELQIIESVVQSGFSFMGSSEELKVDGEKRFLEQPGVTKRQTKLMAESSGEPKVPSIHDDSNASSSPVPQNHSVTSLLSISNVPAINIQNSTANLSSFSPYTSTSSAFVQPTSPPFQAAREDDDNFSEISLQRPWWSRRRRQSGPENLPTPLTPAEALQRAHETQLRHNQLLNHRNTVRQITTRLSVAYGIIHFITVVSILLYSSNLYLDQCETPLAWYLVVSTGLTLFITPKRLFEAWLELRQELSITGFVRVLDGLWFLAGSFSFCWFLVGSVYVVRD
ncbi:hypothetical protein HK096_008400, partial [Nowakowskiella sp. JEL0078]